MPLAPARAALAPANLCPRAGGAAAQVGPSSLCSTTHPPARHHTATTQGRRCLLGAFPTLSGSPPLPARAAGVGSCSDQGHGDCVGVFDFIVPTQWRKCNTDTACVLGVRLCTCASASVLLQVTFQLGFFLTPSSPFNFYLPPVLSGPPL